MKTIVVLSDTHGNRRAVEEIENILSECDYIFHLGDTSADGYDIYKRYPEKTHFVNGNCDALKAGKDEEVVSVEGIKIFLCHGHKYSVKSNLAPLASKAKEAGCSIALYGHTHRAREDEIDGVTILNPGCMTRYAQKSYLYLVVTGEKAVSKIVLI